MVRGSQACGFRLASTLGLLAVGNWLAAAPARAQTSQDEQAIRTASTAYVQALSRGDGAALAALWTADGDIVDERGTVMKGRDAMSLTTKPAEDRPAPPVHIRDTSLRFLAPGVALEDGTVEVSVPGSPVPTTGRFSATWVKQGDDWKLASLRETRIAGASGAEQLADLDWMVGDWEVVDNAGPEGAAKPTIEIAVRWNSGRTYLLRDVKITPPATPGSPAAAPIHVTQRIGWDPLLRQIRSWAFSGDGGHGEAFWTRDGNAWLARTNAVLPDGSQTSSLNVYTYDGKDRCTWQSLHTNVGSEHAPPVNMTMIRKPGRPTK
ncbi:MAG: nuclear transport factor 2 family protein [Planctomycetota bacterium]